MGQQEQKELREKLGEEIIELVDEINRKVKAYAAVINEERPLVVNISSRTNEPYIDAKAYVALDYLEQHGMTREEAARAPELFDVVRNHFGNIDHRMTHKAYIGEEGGENNG